MEIPVRRLLSQMNGTPMRISSTRFARLWDPPISHKLAIYRMRDLLLSPPEGYEVRELEGRRITIEIRRIHK
jgi:hypothetical protein